MASLIQQRMAFERERFFGITLAVSGGIFVAVAFWNITRADALWYPILMGILFSVIFVIGLVQVARSTRRLRRFEAEHGKDAGRQVRPPSSE